MASILDTFVYHPVRGLQGSPKERGLAYEEVNFHSSDGTPLHGWFIPGNSPWILLWCHGSAGNISHRLDSFKRLHDSLGLSVFAFDYRGYGISGGNISEEGLYRDTEAAYRYLLKQGVSTRRLLVYGNSLGGALAVNLLTRWPARGSILEATFTSIRDCARKAFLGSVLPWERFLPVYDSLSRIPQVRVPLLMVHGERDTLIPISMGERLFAAANEPKAFHRVPMAGHGNSYLIGGAAYYQRIGDFVSGLDSLVLTQNSRARAAPVLVAAGTEPLLAPEPVSR